MALIEDDLTALEFEALYREHAATLRAMLSARERDKAAVEDFLQETFLCAYRAWQSVDRSRPMLPWLWTIAKNLRINAHDKRARRPESLSGDIQRIPIVPQAPSAEEDHFAVRGELLEILHMLSPRSRRLISLRYVAGWSYEDIARHEGTSIEAVRCGLARARRSLARAYERSAAYALPAAVPPVLGPVRRRLAALKDFWTRQQVRLGQLVSLDGAVPIGATATAVSHVIVGVAMAATSVAAGDVAPVGSLRADDMASASEAAATALGQVAGATSDADSAERSGPAPGPTMPGGSPVGGPIDPEQAVQNAHDPTHGVDQPEQTSIGSFAFSPRFERDSTVFALGHYSCGASATCPDILFRSTDAGATWTRLPGKGLVGNQILLPPTFGVTDDRIFVVGEGGVKVSTDGGETFQWAHPATGKVTGAVFGTADISPRFGEDDPRIVIGGQALTDYRDDDGLLVPEANPTPYAEMSYRYAPVFADDGSGHPPLFVGAAAQGPSAAGVGTAVLRCNGVTCSRAFLRGHNGFIPPKVVPAPDFATSGVVYALTSGPWMLYVSRDRGASFARVETPWDSFGGVDLAASGDAIYASVNYSIEAASHLWASRDRGRTWKPSSDPTVNRGAGRAGARLGVVAARAGRTLVALPTGLACSSDGGATWAPRCEGP